MPDEPNNERDRPRRLRRLNEVWTPRGRPVFFVTICTADRRPWLDRPEIHRAFVAFCAQSPERAGAWVGQYVLMPDHVHLFVSVDGSQALSRWVGALKRHLAKVHRESGPNPPGAQPRPTPSLDFVGRPCTGGGIDDSPGMQPRPARKALPGMQPRPTNTDSRADVGRSDAGGGIQTAPGAQPRPTPSGNSKAGHFDRAWQAGFLDHLLRSGESYAEKWNYVRMNPVRAGLIEQSEDWPFAGEIEALRW